MLCRGLPNRCKAHRGLDGEVLHIARQDLSTSGGGRRRDHDQWALVAPRLTDGNQAGGMTVTSRPVSARQKLALALL